MKPDIFPCSFCCTQGEKLSKVTLFFKQTPGLSDSQYGYELGHDSNVSGDNVMRTEVCQKVLSLLENTTSQDTIISFLLSQHASW